MATIKQVFRNGYAMIVIGGGILTLGFATVVNTPALPPYVTPTGATPQERDASLDAYVVQEQEMPTNVIVGMALCMVSGALIGWGYKLRRQQDAALSPHP